MAQTPSLSGPFKAFVGAVLGSLAASIAPKRADALAQAHAALTAPLAFQIRDTIQQSIPPIRVLGIDLDGVILGQLPAFESKLTAALDSKAGLLFDFAVATAQKVAQSLAS